MTRGFPAVREYARWAKDALDVPTICGSYHPTTMPEEVIAAEGIDILCRGEGEEALCELVKRLEAGEDYTGVTWIKDDQTQSLFRLGYKELGVSSRLSRLVLQNNRAFQFGAFQLCNQPGRRFSKCRQYAVSYGASIILFLLRLLTVSIMIQRLISLPTVPDNLCLISHTVLHKPGGHL